MGQHPSSPACVPSGYYPDETQLANQQQHTPLETHPLQMNSTPDPVPQQQRPWPKDEPRLLYRPLEFRSPIKLDRKPSIVFWAEEYQASNAFVRAGTRMRKLAEHFQKARSDADLIDTWESAYCREAQMNAVQMHKWCLKRSLPRPVAARLSAALPDFDMKRRMWKALYTDAVIRSHPIGCSR